MQLFPRYRLMRKDTFKLFYYDIIKLLTKFWFRHFVDVNPWFTRLLSSVKLLSVYHDLAKYKRVVCVTVVSVMSFNEDLLVRMVTGQEVLL